MYNNSSTARLLIASREAEALLSDVSQYKRESLELDFGGNHSDSEDSISSHRSNLSMLSETFSPPNSSRHYFIEVCFSSLKVIVSETTIYCVNCICKLCLWIYSRMGNGNEENNCFLLF